MTINMFIPWCPRKQPEALDTLTWDEWHSTSDASIPSTRGSFEGRHAAEKLPGRIKQAKQAKQASKQTNKQTPASAAPQAAPER